MKKIKSLLVFSMCLTMSLLFLSCEKEEESVPELKQETVLKEDSEINATNKTSSTFWSPWLTNNPNGVVRPANIFSRPDTNLVTFSAYEQAGYGIVNLQLVGKNPNIMDPVITNPIFATTNKRGVQKISNWPLHPFNENATTTKIEVKEQYGYGIIDMRIFDEINRPSNWVTNNPNVTRYRSYKAPNGYKIVGMQTKEQAGFGIVDIRVYVRKI